MSGSERPRAGWAVLTATELGAAHRARGQELQDAVAVRHLAGDGLAVAVADGHGDRRHFRSARGSALAVEIGCQAAAELAERLGSLASAGQIEDEARAELVPAVIGRWRAAALADLAKTPLSAAEEVLRADGDDNLIAYGSTLLVALIAGRWLVLAQIGDGDVLAVGADGSAHLPVPADPVLDGRSTTSLCGVRPEADFRVRAVDLAGTPFIALLVATDGYGNAQAAASWTEAVSADLADLVGEHPPGWFADQLPSWVRACASADGSADDTTAALLIAPDAASRRRLALSAMPAVRPGGRTAGVAPSTTPVADAGSRPPVGWDARAEPGSPRDAATTGGPPGTPPGFSTAPEARSRRRMAMLAAAGAIALVLVAVAGVRLLTASPASTHPAGPRPTTLSSGAARPSASAGRASAGRASAGRASASRRPSATQPTAGPSGAPQPASGTPSAIRPSLTHPVPQPGGGASGPGGQQPGGAALPPGPRIVVRGPGFTIVFADGQIWWCLSDSAAPADCVLVADLGQFRLGIRLTAQAVTGVQPGDDAADVVRPGRPLDRASEVSRLPRTAARPRRGLADGYKAGGTRASAQ